MNQPDDKPLHDWVRRSLADYRPVDKPDDWGRLQRRLRNRRWRQGGIKAGMMLLLLSAVGWLWLPNDTPTLTRRTTHDPRTNAPTTLLVGGVKPVNTASPDRPTKGSQYSRSRGEGPRPPLSPDGRKRERTPIPLLTPPLRPGHKPTDGLARRLTTVQWNGEVPAIVEQLTSGQFGTDSTSYQVLARNLTRWPDAVIVCDLTTSMYPYTTQLVSWLRQQTTQPDLLGMLFFTDCDSLGRQTRPDGPPGQVFVVRNPQPESVLRSMLAAARNTVRNQDDAENDIDALVAARRVFPQAQHLILVADNLSRVKDIARLASVDRPVHVILCGTTGGTLTQPFQPDFERIARQTGGSLHTLEDDLDPTAIVDTQTLHVGQHYYRYNRRRQQFQLTSFQHRPRRWFSFLWL